MNNRRIWIRTLYVVLTLVVLGYGIKWWEDRGEGFRLYKIQEKICNSPRWELSVTPADIEMAKKIFASQKFTYLAHGFQCYAFQSEDKKYILKFFRYQRLRQPEFIQKLPSFPILDEWRKERLLTLSHRRECLLRSCKTSWELAKRETAILFVHLNETSNLIGKATIRDSLDNEYTLDMDHYQFMLQKKALHIKPEFARLMAQGDIEGAKRRIDNIFELLIDCSRKSIQDMDGALIRKNNLGFLGDRAIYIDGGKLVYRSEIRSKKYFEKDLKRLNPLRKWFGESYPELLRYFDEREAYVKEHFEELINESPRTVEE